MNDKSYIYIQRLIQVVFQKRWLFTTFGFIILFTVHAEIPAARKITLDQAIETALHNNPAVKAGNSMIKASNGKILQARSLRVPKADMISKYFNSNNLPGMYSIGTSQVPVMDENGPITGQYVPLHPMAPFPNNVGNVLTMDVNLNLPVYTGGKIDKANQNAIILKKSYEFDLRQTKEEIIFNVKTVFNNILFLQELIHVNQEALQQLNEHLKYARDAYEQGVRSEFDVLSFESKIEAFKSSLADLDGKLAIAETGLKNLLALPMETNIQCQGKISNEAGVPWQTQSRALDRVLQSNSQLQSLQLKQKMLSNMEDIIKADKKPTLFLFSNYHVYHGMDFPPFNLSWRNGYAIGIGLKINIFDGNMNKGKVMESKANTERLGNLEEGLKLKLRFAVKEAYEQLKALQARYIALNSNQEVAGKAYRIATVGYENGVITNLELDDAQLNLTRVRTMILSVKKDLLITRAKLEYLEGTEHVTGN